MVRGSGTVAPALAGGGGVRGNDTVPAVAAPAAEMEPLQEAPELLDLLGQAVVQEVPEQMEQRAHMLAAVVEKKVKLVVMVLTELVVFNTVQELTVKEMLREVKNVTKVDLLVEPGGIIAANIKDLDVLLLHGESNAVILLLKLELLAVKGGMVDLVEAITGKNLIP